MKQKTKCAIGASILAPLSIMTFIGLMIGIRRLFLLLPINLQLVIVLLLLVAVIGLFVFIAWNIFFECCTDKHKDIIEKEKVE